MLRHYKNFPAKEETCFPVCAQWIKPWLPSCLVPWRVTTHGRRELRLDFACISPSAEEAGGTLSGVQVPREGCEELRARKFLPLPRETKQRRETNHPGVSVSLVRLRLSKHSLPLANISKYNGGSSQSMHLGADHYSPCKGLYFVQMRKMWDIGSGEEDQEVKASLAL